MNISSLLTRLLLLVSGLVGITVGGMLLFTPVMFHASAEISLGDNPSLLSEVRSPGAFLLPVSAFMLLAVFREHWQTTAVTVSAITYSSYAAGRLVSILLDGMPSSSILGAFAIEVTIGLLASYVAIRSRSKA